MTQDTNAELVQRIEAFCEDAGISVSTFGFRSVNDGKLVDRLRSGRTITLRTLQSIETSLETAKGAA